MKKILTYFVLIMFSQNVFSSEKALLDLAEYHYNQKEYYNSVTETMRYQFLYPDGKLLPRSMIIMGKSYYKGGNKEKGLFILSECYNRFSDSEYGETALFLSGIMRLETGSYNYAAKNLREYNYVFNRGIFNEEAIINLSLSYALAENYTEADKKLKDYKKTFPEGKFRNRADELSALLESEKLSEKKSLFIAGLSSALIPGSGYFYTGNYKLGVFSFFTNGALIYGIYDGYKKKSQFQMIIFSMMELSFYNYSIFGSIKKADEYNREGGFKKESFLGLRTRF